MELAEGGKFVCCLFIVVIFMRLGGAYRLGRILKPSYGGQSTKGTLLLGELTPQGTK